MAKTKRVEIVDRFTGKLVDKPSDRLPHLNGGLCDECGTELIDHCLTCGAPVCCPKCCGGVETPAAVVVEVPDED